MVRGGSPYIGQGAVATSFWDSEHGIGVEAGLPPRARGDLFFGNIGENDLRSEAARCAALCGNACEID
jgi:hypothetical protein